MDARKATTAILHLLMADRTISPLSSSYEITLTIGWLQLPEIFLRYSSNYA